MYCGTPSYMSPEVVEKRLYNPKPVDIWAMGVVLFKLLTGDYAFGAEDEPNLKKNILAGKVVSWPQTMSTKVRSLIAACFDLDAGKRIKIEEIETHPWMVKYKDLI